MDEEPTPQQYKKMDVFDQEFSSNLKIAKGLVERVEKASDREICKKWLKKLCEIKTNETTVKKNRNAFFKYFLQVLHRCVESGGDDEHHGYPQFDSDKKKKSSKKDEEFMCRWSSDRRTYVAAKPLPGQGTLIYMAVAKEPRLGWEKNGVLFKF